MLKIISLCVLSLCCSGNLRAQNLRMAGSPATNNTEHVAAQPLDNQTQLIGLNRFYEVVDKTLALKDTQAKVLGAARLADLLWKYDEAPARELFTKALSLTNVEADPEKRKLLTRLRQNVLALLARRDRALSKQLLDANPVAGEDDNSNGWSETNIEIASTLVQDQPENAIDFAARSLQRGVGPSFIWFLKELRGSHEPEANQLFLQALDRFAQQPAADVNDLALLGTYIFTSPKASSADPTNVIFTRVGDVGIIDITADQPGVSPLLIRAFLKASIKILSRQNLSAYQRQTSYALGYLLLPKARLYAPDLLPVLGSAIASLSAVVPPSITHDAAYENIKKVRPDNADIMADAEKISDPQSRDTAYLDVAFHAWLDHDFATARKAAGKLAGQDAGKSLTALIDFGEGSSLLNQPMRLLDAESFANKLPQGIERAVLLLGLAHAADKSGNAPKTIEVAGQAIQAACSVSDARRPFLILMAAGQLASLDPVASQSALTDAIKEFNKQEENEIETISWQQKVEAGSLVQKFPLSLDGVEFGFRPAFSSAISGSSDDAVSTASNLKSENLRALAFVEIGRVILESVPTSEQTGEATVRVGEDGMRKSAAKTVMPVYPEEARKGGQQGLAVVEVQYNGQGNVTDAVVVEVPSPAVGDAVVKAVRQWKFKPSTLKGEPISVRGKLTFYFVIDKDGTARVENPKQFQ